MVEATAVPGFPDVPGGGGGWADGPSAVEETTQLPVFPGDDVSAVERTAPMPVVTGADAEPGPFDAPPAVGRAAHLGPFDGPNPFDAPGPFDALNPFDAPVRRDLPAQPAAPDPADRPVADGPLDLPGVSGPLDPPGPPGPIDPIDREPAEAGPVLPPPPAQPPAPPSSPPPAPSTGWTSVMPVIVQQQQQAAPGSVLGPVSGPGPVLASPPAAAAPAPLAPTPTAPGGGLGAAPRGRILVVEGGYGTSGRRSWGRGGANQAPVLSAMLAAVSPQMLLAADAVDAVHLPGANDPQTVLAHLRAASRHPGPLLVHFGGHLVGDRRDGQLYLTLRDSKPGTVRQDGLSWQAVVAELQHRSAEWQTLVIADLSADQNAWPQLQSTISPLADGIPLWAVVSPDPEQIGTFTRALIEALHGGRPGAEAVLAPEQLRQQVYSVLRPDVVILTSHAPDRPVFRNTARRSDGAAAEPVPYEGPRPVAVQPRPPVRRDVPSAAVPAAAPATVAPPRVRLDKAGAAAVAGPQVSLDKPGAAAEPVRPAVMLAKAGAPSAVRDAGAPEVVTPEPSATKAVTLRKGIPAEPADKQPAPVGRPVTLAKPAAAALPEAVEAVEAVEAAGNGTDPHPDPDPDHDPDHDPAHDADPEATAELPLPAAVPDEAAGASAEAEEGPASDGPAPLADYREAIGRIVRSADAGEHEAAAELALELERQTVAVHGPTAAPVLQVRQVRAHVSRLAGRTGEAADLYREVALVLLRAQGADHPETQQAATNAEACWRAIADRAEALKVAPDIIELRAYLPGPDGRKLRAAERYLAQLAATPSAY